MGTRAGRSCSPPSKDADLPAHPSQVDTDSYSPGQQPWSLKGSARRPDAPPGCGQGFPAATGGSGIRPHQGWAPPTSWCLGGHRADRHFWVLIPILPLPLASFGSQPLSLRSPPCVKSRLTTATLLCAVRIQWNDRRGTQAAK